MTKTRIVRYANHTPTHRGPVKWEPVEGTHIASDRVYDHLERSLNDTWNKAAGCSAQFLFADGSGYRVVREAIVESYVAVHLSGEGLNTHEVQRVLREAFPDATVAPIPLDL